MGTDVLVWPAPTATAPAPDEAGSASASDVPAGIVLSATATSAIAAIESTAMSRAFVVFLVVRTLTIVRSPGLALGCPQGPFALFPRSGRQGVQCGPATEPARREHEDAQHEPRAAWSAPKSTHKET